MLLAESDIGDETESSPGPFDDLYEDVGLPELKGISDRPAPEPVDDQQLRLLVARQLDEESRRRLHLLIASYREWADAFLRIRRETK